MRDRARRLPIRSQAATMPGMASYRVRFPGGVEVECATADEAAALIGQRANAGKPAEPAPPPVMPAPEAPQVQVFGPPGSGGRGVDALREIEGAAHLVWDWLTSEKDPRAAIVDALKNAGKR